MLKPSCVYHTRRFRTCRLAERLLGGDGGTRAQQVRVAWDSHSLRPVQVVHGEPTAPLTQLVCTADL